MNLKELNKKINSCKKCDLSKIRIKAVPGEGPSNAKIILLGQAPGKQEDLQGKPFVGRAGKFLDYLLNIASLKRRKVFITGSVKCFPPKNRKPTQKELDKCKPYLLKQIKIIKPKLIVLLGDVALNSLLGKGKVSKLHGRFIKKKDMLYFITFHPAAGMRFPKIKKQMVEDFKKLKEF